MPNQIRDISSTDEESYPYIFEQNFDVPIKTFDKGLIFVNAIVLRKGNPGFNDPAAELAAFPRRTENEWPISRTQYTRFYLTAEEGLTKVAPSPSDRIISYKAPGTAQDPQSVQFTTPPFTAETEITGNIVAHLNIPATSSPSSNHQPSDIDIFVTLRHFDPEGNEIFYTGTMGDPVPIVKGWLRVSLRKVETHDPRHRLYLPYREYRRADVQGIKAGEVYPVGVGLWPTNVVVSKGSVLSFEVSSGDTQGTGIFGHCDPEDRSDNVFAGLNSFHFGDGQQKYITVPIIPQA